MTSRQRTDEIAREAAQAARVAAEEARTPEARFFLRQHALLLERVAGRRRKAEGAAARVTPPVTAVLPLVPFVFGG
jgi:hypothetical protein